MLNSSVKQWVLGYYPVDQLERYPIDSIDWSCLTHLACARVRVNPGGTPHLDFDVEIAKKLARAAVDNGVTPLLMLGGEDEGPKIADMAADQGTRDAFSEALLQMMDDLGYFGIDLDWENYKAQDHPADPHPKDVPVDADHLVSLARKMREDRPNIILTFPTPALNPDDPSTFDIGNGPKKWFDHDCEVAAAVASQVNKVSVMTYIGTFLLGFGWNSWFVSPLTGAATGNPVAIDDSLQRYAANGIPRSKLMLGIGGYAICYPPYITEPHQKTIDPGTPGHENDEITGGDNNFPLGDMFTSGSPLDQFPDARKSDGVGQQSYLSLPTATAFGDLSGNTPTRYISYDDQESIVAKAKWSRDNGFGGAIVWTLPELLPSPSRTVMKGRAPDALVQALRKGFLS